MNYSQILTALATLTGIASDDVLEATTPIPANYAADIHWPE